MNKIQALNKRKEELYAAQEQVLNAAEEAKSYSKEQKEQVEKFTNEIQDIEKQVATLQAIADGRKALGALTSEPVVPNSAAAARAEKKTFSPEYHDAFWGAFSKGRNGFLNTSLNEGTSDEGQLLVPISVDGTIVPLVTVDQAVRKLANVIPTSGTLILPAQKTKAQASAKAESEGSTEHEFTETNPTFTDITLRAYMAGGFVPITMELAEDVPALQAFLKQDLSDAVLRYEDDKFVNGSGTGEPEGVLTGADAGQTATLTAEHSLDMLAKLKAGYYGNASWLMHRQSGVNFRKAQLSANQFNQYWTTEGGQDKLHGYPVYFSAAMPVYSASPAVSGAIVFGDFKRGYVIGDRNGSAIQIRIDDITGLKAGKINVFGFRRTDAAVRVSEALKVWTVTG